MAEQQTQTPPPPAPLALKDLITEAGLTDRGWVKDFADKSLDKDTALAVLKKLDGAESLIGKRKDELIPGVDAKPEEWDKFFGKMRPAKPEDYEFKLGEKPDENFVKAFRESAHHAGLTKLQTQRLVEKLTPHFQESVKAKEAADAKREEDFAAALKEMTGGADFSKRTERVQAAARALVPEAARAHIDRMKDQDLALFTVFADALLSKYAKEDEFGGKENDGGKPPAGDDKESLIKELHTLYASDGWKDFRHADHEKTKKRIDEILGNAVFKTQ
jgi:hypothetical protein